jgi:hypothetical protein
MDGWSGESTADPAREAAARGTPTRRGRGRAVLVWLLYLAVPPAGWAQRARSEVGFQLGYSNAGFTGQTDQLSESREGTLFGLFWDRDLAGPVSGQVELLFVKKGGGLSGQVQDIPVRISVQLVYVELPVLARISVPTGRRWRPTVFGGASLALTIGCDFQAEVPGQVVQQRCDEAGGVALAGTDFGLIAGGGLEYQWRASAVRFEFRQEFGLKRVTTSDVRNRAWALLLGLTF